MHLARSNGAGGLSRLFGALLLVAISCGLAGCAGPGSGNVIRRSFPVGSFSEIEMRGVGSLAVGVGAAPSVVIETDDDVVGQFRAIVDGETLRISRDENDPKPTAVHVDVTLPRLRALRVRGRMVVAVAGPIRGESLSIGLSGRTRASIETLAVDSLEIRIRGRSTLEMIGRAEKLTIYGKLDRTELRLEELEVRDAELSLFGTGNFALNVSESLAGVVKGTGSLRITGAPKKIDLDVDWHGPVVARGHEPPDEAAPQESPVSASAEPGA